MNAESTDGVRVFDDAFAWWYIVINDKAYYGKEVIDGADADHFKPLGQNFSTDGQRIFWNAHPVIGADPNTFNVNATEPPEQGEDGQYYLKLSVPS